MAAIQPTQRPEENIEVDHDSLHMIIRNREELIFEGVVKSITSFNKVGKFDVLPQHSNFISLIEKQLTYRIEGGREETLPITNGIIKVENNVVRIYLGVGEQ